jgi:DNA polymerase V
MSIVTVSLIETPIPAGFPSPAADYQEKRIDIAQYLVPHPISTFFVRTTGDSMINAFIPPLALLIVDRSKSAHNGDIVVAVINGEFTVKFLRKNDLKCWLVPANRKYSETEITAEMEFIIWGVVTYIVSNPKDLKNVCLP